MVKLSAMVIGLVRSKFLALLIGPTGYGIMGLFQSTLDMIQLGTGLGIETSGVKKIASQEIQSDSKKLNQQVNILVNMSLYLGILGIIITVILAKPLSIFTFGNDAYTIGFIWLAFSLVFRRITLIQSTVFQGLQFLSLLAKSNLWANLLGFVLTIPLFLIYKVDAIVPSMVLSSIIGLMVTSFYYQKINIPFQYFSIKSTFKEGNDVIKFGILLSISSFLVVVSNFLIQIFISQNSGIEEVGLFNVGLVLVNSYVGLVFTAMSTDYFPQLASVVDNPEKTGEFVSKQAIFSLLLVTPVVLFFIIFIPFLIPLLFSKQFLPIIPMSIFLIGAMFFKALSWSFGYLIIAKADSKVFMKSTFFFNSLYVFLACFGFYQLGLVGVGYAFSVYFFLHLVFVFSIINWRYKILLD